MQFTNALTKSSEKHSKSVFECCRIGSKFWNPKIRHWISRTKWISRFFVSFFWLKSHESLQWSLDRTIRTPPHRLALSMRGKAEWFELVAFFVLPWWPVAMLKAVCQNKANWGRSVCGLQYFWIRSSDNHTSNNALPFGTTPVPSTDSHLLFGLRTGWRVWNSIS